LRNTKRENVRLTKSAITKMQAAVVVVIILIVAIVGVYYATLPGPAPSPTPTPTPAPTPTPGPTPTPAPTPTPTKEPIKIGIEGSMTGVEAWIGFDGYNGAMLAVEEINMVGGINGRPIQLINYDDGGSPEGAVTVSRKLIFEDGVVAGILNQGSELALASGKIFDGENIPALVPWAGHEDIVKGGWCFRVGLTARAPGKAMGYYAYTVLGAKKLACVVTVDPYEESYAEAMKEVFTKLGGQVVYDKLVEFGEKEYTAMLTEIKASGADVILGPHDFSMSIPFTSQARGLEVMTPIMFGSSSCVPEYLDGVKDVGELGGGVFVLSYMVFEDPLTSQYAEKYEARYGKAAGPTASYTSYDCIKMLAQIIEQAGDDPAKIREGIMALKDFKGVGGTIAKYEQGECLKPIPIYSIKENKFVLAQLVTELEYISPF